LLQKSLQHREKDLGDMSTGEAKKADGGKW